MSLDDRARALSWLRSCSDEDLADLFYEAVSARVVEESPAFRTHYVLGQATLYVDTSSVSTPGDTRSGSPTPSGPS